MSFINYVNKIEKRNALVKKLFESKTSNQSEVDNGIINYFNKELDNDYKFVKVGMYNSESFGTIDGALYISEDKSAIRINWIEKNLVGISYWINYNLKYIDYEFEFTGTDTVEDLKDNLPSIISYLKTSIEKYDDDKNNEDVTGKYEIYSNTNDNEIIVDKDGCSQIIDDIFNETNTENKSKTLKKLIKSIARKVNNSLLILGVDGNKNITSEVKTILQNNSLSVGEDYIVRTCQNDNDVLLKTLYDFNDRIIVFDNADNMILKSDDVSKTTRQLLIPSLSKTFTITETDKDGNSTTKDFDFTGSIILITNITKNRLRIKDKEVVSKCMSINMKEDVEDIQIKMKKAINDIFIYTSTSIGGDAKKVKDRKLLEEVIDFLISNDFIYNNRNKSNSFTYELLQNVFLIAKSKNKNWKFIALDLL